tara:strand:+ start:15700 stop:15984 length:285 start_codon:yes stop_codon:yes gene_type:complete
MKAIHKVRTVNPSLVSYRGFYFQVTRSYHFNGGVKSCDYYGVSAGMKLGAYSKADIKKVVDRRLEIIMRKYIASQDWSQEDSPVLAKLLDMEAA